jgi:hypothetical protein
MHPEGVLRGVADALVLGLALRSAQVGEETRNPKQIPMAEARMLQTEPRRRIQAQRQAVLDLRYWDFEFVSGFGFRNSDFIYVRRSSVKHAG